MSFFKILDSTIFSNIIAVLGLVIALIPQKDSISIDNSTKYYFQNESNSSKKTRPVQDDFIFGLIYLSISYILYAIFQPYFVFLLIFLTFCVILRYRYLKIAYLSQMTIPAILITTTALTNYFLPKEVLNYWDTVYKLNFSNMGTLSELLNQLTVPVSEIYTLLTTVTTSPLSVSVIATILFAILSTTSLIGQLSNKQNIKVNKPGDIIGYFLFIAIIVSFMFYTEPHSPARILMETVSNFLLN